MVIDKSMVARVDNNSGLSMASCLVFWSETDGGLSSGPNCSTAITFLEMDDAGRVCPKNRGESIIKFGSRE